MKELKVKSWVIDKAAAEAKRFNTWIDFTRRTDDAARRPLIEDGCVYVLAEEVLSETEKAVRVKLSTGGVVGSTKGWTLWIPKSQILPINEEA